MAFLIEAFDNGGQEAGPHCERQVDAESQYAIRRW